MTQMLHGHGPMYNRIAHRHERGDEHHEHIDGVAIYPPDHKDKPMLMYRKPEKVATPIDLAGGIAELMSNPLVNDDSEVWTEVEIEDQGRPGKTIKVRVPIAKLAVTSGAITIVWSLVDEVPA
jgi:hypothetical protein